MLCYSFPSYCSTKFLLTSNYIQASQSHHFSQVPHFKHIQLKYFCFLQSLYMCSIRSFGKNTCWLIAFLFSCFYFLTHFSQLKTFCSVLEAFTLYRYYLQNTLYPHRWQILRRELEWNLLTPSTTN